MMRMRALSNAPQQYLKAIQRIKDMIRRRNTYREYKALTEQSKCDLIERLPKI